MITLIVLHHIQDHIIELSSLCISIVSCQIRIINSCLTPVVSLVKRKRTWTPVHILKSMSENLNTITKGVLKWLPDPLHALLFHPFVPVLIVDSCEEECIKAHVREQSWIALRVTKRIDMPSNGWNIVELSEQELMAKHHVVHDVVVMGACLIMHGPSSVHKLQSVLIDKHAHLGLQFSGLPLPPHGEELHLYIGEGEVRIVQQLLDDRVQDVLDIGECYVVPGTSVVFVYGFEPANIIVGVRNYMHVECSLEVIVPALSLAAIIFII